MATAGLILATLGGAGVIAARLLVLHRLRRLSWDREIPLIVALPFVIVVLVLAANADEPLSRTDPVLAGSAAAIVLGSLATYAFWLAQQYQSRTQRLIGVASLAAAAVSLGLTAVIAIGRLV